MEDPLGKAMATDDFIEDLKKMLREWEWPAWKINQDFPKVISAFVSVGILRLTDTGFQLTPKVGEDAAWDAAWDILGKDGVTQLGEQAS